MIDEKSKILIHRAIDGELSEVESNDFNRLIESSLEARQFHGRLQALALIPTQLPAIDPPSELRSQILDGVVESRRHTKPVGSNPRSIGALIGTLLTPRLAYGLAAGLIVGIGLSALTSNSPVSQLNPLDLSGTLVSGKDSKGLIRVDADSFAGGQATGRLGIDVGSGLIYIQMELHSAQEVAIVLEYDPSAYTLRAFEQQSPVSGNIVTRQGQLQASHVGENRYLFVLARVGESSSPVVCRVESTGVIYRRELRL